MKSALTVWLLFAVVTVACSRAVPEVKFCDVLTARAGFQNRVFETEIVVVPDLHGRFAAGFQCHGVALAFSDASWDGSSELRKLDDAIEKAERSSNGPLPWKGVAARVKARIEKNPSPPPTHVLRLLEANEWREVDLPRDLFDVPGRAKAPESESSEQAEAR